MLSSLELEQQLRSRQQQRTVHHAAKPAAAPMRTPGRRKPMASGLHAVIESVRRIATPGRKRRASRS